MWIVAAHKVNKNVRNLIIVHILNDDSTFNAIQYKCKYVQREMNIGEANEEIHQFYLTLKFKTHFFNFVGQL